MRLEGHVSSSLDERVSTGESFTKTWKVANTGEYCRECTSVSVNLLSAAVQIKHTLHLLLLLLINVVSCSDPILRTRGTGMVFFLLFLSVVNVRFNT